MFSCTCSGRLAPVITVDTFGFAAHHAIESWASEQPRSFGDGLEPPHARVRVLVGHPIPQPLVALQ